MERQANTADLMPHESFNAILQSSVLGPLVKRLLKSASIQDLIEHEKLFVSLSRLIGILAVHSETRSFVMEPLCADAGLLKFFNTGKCEIEAGKDTIQGLVGDIAKQTKVFIKVQIVGSYLRFIMAVYPMTTQFLKLLQKFINYRKKLVL